MPRNTITGTVWTSRPMTLTIGERRPDGLFEARQDNGHATVIDRGNLFQFFTNPEHEAGRQADGTAALAEQLLAEELAA
jgi:hypothetical protein